jgi:hypothetical protein
VLVLGRRTARSRKADFEGGARGASGHDKTKTQVPVSMNKPGHSQS